MASKSGSNAQISTLEIVAALAGDRHFPGDRVQTHAQVLERSIGPVSTTRLNLQHQKAVQLAERSRDPAEFENAYRDISRDKSSMAMIEVLHEIAGDKKVVAELTNFKEEKSELQLLKQKLLGEANRQTTQDDIQNAASIYKRMFTDRQFQTRDFISNVQFPSSNRTGTLGGIPAKSQEHYIVRDLIYVFIGLEGTHVKVSPTLQLKVDPTIDPTLGALLKRAEPFCSAYSAVVRFAERHYQMSYGRVNQALSGAVSAVLKEHVTFMTQLQNRAELTLNQFWYMFQPTHAIFVMLKNICVAIENEDARGGLTLSILHDHLVNNVEDEYCQNIAEFLIKSAALPFFETLSLWVHKGIIQDPGNDFFVQDNEVVDRTLLPLEYSDDYWEKRYSTRTHLIPSFLSTFVDIILRTGKYLNVIYQTGKSANINSEAFVGYNPDPVVYTPVSEEYNEVLTKAHDYASKELLNCLLKEKDLIGHLKSVKHYFLLDQGDFIVQFMDLCESELSQSVADIKPSRLDALLDLALRTSAANADPYKDNLSVELLPYDLLFQMCRILSIDTDEELEYKSPENLRELTGLEAFAFGYEVQWPISLILNRISLARYQMLLRHLLHCKHLERILSKTWVLTKGSRGTGSNFAGFTQSFALRQKMVNFLQNLEYYMTFEVLEPNWENMVSKIADGKTENVDQVLKIHSDFLTTCLADCMLDNPQLLTTVKKLLGICEEFANFLTENVDECTDPEQFTQETSKYDLSFSSVLFSLLDKLAQIGRDNYNQQILNMMHRLDFNGFYSRVYDKFGC